ncbi:MAG: Metallo-dependent phosphatase-like protein [Linnemannia gamsii]|nr:MAG: Metallo-dependent phosphatase-like protein [Linnemannia gamsii]
MLFRIQTLAFAVAAFVCATATAQTTPIHPTADQVRELIVKAATTKKCDDCVAAVRISTNYARDDTTVAIELAKSLCPRVTKYPADVCNGYLDMQLPVMIKSALRADYERGDDKVICHAVLGMCPSPTPTTTTIRFPKRKPRFPTVPRHSGKLVDVVHLSDWHVDELYEPGVEAACDKPICCRTYPTTNTTAPPRRAAATWGDYRCDTPVKLTQDLMKFIRKEIPNIDFAILTGDVPPHDTWLQTKETVVPIEERAYGLIESFLGKDVNVYPAIGNHDAGPTNLFPTERSGGNIQWLYNSLSTQWSSWLSPRELASVRHNHGAYSTTPHRGFRLISLNTNFCYKDNLYLYSDLRDLDPNHEIHWLIRELQYAEDHRERVWVIAHIAPYQTDCLENWSELYHQVIQRYSPHVVAEQFFGHSHTDEFSIYYGAGGDKTAKNAIATAWTAPSVAPFTNINPGFRTYKVDTGSWNVFESVTYIANLDQAATWDATGATPNWHVEYSAREAYGVHVPIAPTAPLSAAWWHNVTVAFEADPANMTGPFQDFWKRRGKMSKLIPTCLGNTTCPGEMICTLRSARGADACIVPGSGFRKRDDGEEGHVEGAIVEGDRPWLQKMCGQFTL